MDDLNLLKNRFARLADLREGFSFRACSASLRRVRGEWWPLLTLFIQEL